MNTVSLYCDPSRPSLYAVLAPGADLPRGMEHGGTWNLPQGFKAIDAGTTSGFGAPSASGWIVVQEGGAGAEIIDYLGAPMLQLPGNLTFPCTPA